MNKNFERQPHRDSVVFFRSSLSKMFQNYMAQTALVKLMA